MRTVEQEQVASVELALPASVQEALGKLVGAAKAGLQIGMAPDHRHAEIEERLARFARKAPPSPSALTRLGPTGPS